MQRGSKKTVKSLDFKLFLCKYSNSLFIEEKIKNAFRGAFPIHDAELYTLK